jgi:hypothetical protein
VELARTCEVKYLLYCKVVCVDADVEDLVVSCVHDHCATRILATLEIGRAFIKRSSGGFLGLQHFTNCHSHKYLHDSNIIYIFT